MENGPLYNFLIDPMMRPIHRAVSSLVSEQDEIIDLACGTAALAIELSKNAKHVIGVDHSSSMLSIGQKQIDQLGLKNIKLVLSDVIHLNGISEQNFSKAIVSLAIHQFPLEIAHQLIDQMMKMSPTLIIIDYQYPQPKNFYGKSVHIIERIAGKEHFRNFKNYLDFGGLPAFAKHHNLTIENSSIIAKGIITISTLKSNTNGGSSNKFSASHLY